MKTITYNDALEYVKQVIANDLAEEEDLDEPECIQAYVQVSTRILGARSFEEVFGIWHDFEGYGSYSEYIPRVLDRDNDLVVEVEDDEILFSKKPTR